MVTPAVDDRPPPASDHLHMLLAERGAAILPEPANADGRVTLTDAMLAIAVLAACFALIRASLEAGLVSLALVVPALARTHVVMVRRRGIGLPSNAGGWLLAFASSTLRIGPILGLVPVIGLASPLLGSVIGHQFTAVGAELGAVLGFFILGLPLIILALFFLVPLFLSVRDPIQR
jgi:hypothetical protein